MRRYEERAIEPAVIDRLKEAMLRSPSSRAIRPWRFVFVTDGAKLAQLSHAKSQYGEFLAKASLGVVVCADESASDAWVEDCSIAATILQISAAGLSLGSCWIQIRGRDHGDGTSAEAFVSGLLDLPEGWRVECIVAVGYPAEEKPAHERDRLKWEAVTEA